MKQKMVKVEPVALLPTPSGCAVFLGDSEKVILIYIDPSIGASINMALQQEKAPRPLTHDLFHSVLDGFGAEVTRVVIVKADGDVFFARLFLQVENELTERKIVELDARPSDSIALAVRDSAPIYVLESVWSELNDVSGLLDDMKNSQSRPDDDDEFNFDDEDDVPF
ncbi:MAG: bifunctional DNase/RNase [Cryomorphaceae bacterium]|jgi:bifunctional DNase/RNase